MSYSKAKWDYKIFKAKLRRKGLSSVERCNLRRRIALLKNILGE